MKISSVKPWLVNVPAHSADVASSRRKRQFVFVQITTDDGLTGWGEVTTYPGPVANRAICSVISEIEGIIKGDDASRIEALWQKIFRAFTYMGTRGATTAVVSGIDIALWDIRGKALGLPVYELLGGAVRDDILLYTHPPTAQNPEQSARDALDIAATGHTALKTDPFAPEMQGKGTAYLDGQISAEAEALGVEIVAAIRDAVGPEFEILIDAHGNYNVPTAIRLANALEPYDITWFEEPVPVESRHALRQVREQVGVRISIGERIHTRFDFVPVFENELADFVMPDVTWTGGISELKKISTMAEAYYVPVSPHDASGPINVLAGAHVMMTTPNFYRLETSRARLDGYNAFIEEPLNVRSGRLIMPDRPGLGIEMNIDYLEANAELGFGGT